MKTTIQIEKSLRDELAIMKIQKKLDSIEDVIKELLKKSKKEETQIVNECL